MIIQSATLEYHILKVYKMLNINKLPLLDFLYVL